MSTRVDIQSVNNGYVVSYFVNSERVGEWIAESWLEVMLLLDRIGAPDVEQEVGKDGEK